MEGRKGPRSDVTEQSQMAEQGRIATPTVGATDRRGRLTSNMLLNAAYGRMSFTSCLGRPSKTGFTSNQRPAIYYTPSLDQTDNPQFGLSLSDSYMSQTKLHYQPHIQSDYLPNIINKPRDSGFLQTRTQPKTAAMEEKTEYQRSFLDFPLPPAVSRYHVTVGPKTETGFTEGRDLTFFTFQEKNNCTDKPPQAHSTVMKNDFKPPSWLQGTEAILGVCSRSCRESGFTQGVAAPLACPSSLLPSPETKSNAPTLKAIGRKEPTGFLLAAQSNQIFPKTPLDGSHFSTHYKSTFCHHADLEKLKSGPTCAGIISTKMDNSYTRREMDRFIFRG
ncbi:protein phosphatase 1 regulatory subunit 32 isoform X1 [Acanthochromis polyacanthus]|uniref:Stabilizer of axonemal microtubules 4 n=3 Tax=Acanthochromis polyacanthus TaxID=80966 RepID=A0A3Q1FG96_9TELE|nr:protein phosphatase 1 regulatory subunit 32 isoform X1 [Acanthochromis polyacanthus]